MRPRYDWGLALARGISATWKAGSAGSLISGAISKQWVLSVAASLGAAFFGGVFADLDGYIAEVKAWDDSHRDGQDAGRDAGQDAGQADSHRDDGGPK